MHPVVGVVGGFALAHALGAVVVASIAFSPTAEPSRESFLAHAADVIEKMRAVGIAPKNKRLKSLHKDIKLLREHIGIGWHLSGEMAAGVRIAAFVIEAHAKSTGYGLVKVADVLGKSILETGNKLGKTLVDALFQPMPERHYWEGRHPAEI